MLVLALSGCAATVEQSGPQTPASAIPAASSQNIVLNITGSSVSTGAKDWADFKEAWRSEMAEVVAAHGAKFSYQDGPPRPTGEAGTLVVVDVADYRYLTPGARIGLGIMTGNAYVDAEVSLRDLKTGKEFGSRHYNTSSSAWEGVFSAMTPKQVAAISESIVAEIGPR